MNPNPNLLARLRHLRLSGMAEALPARLAQAEGGTVPYLEFLELLVEDELHRRADRLFGRRVKQAEIKVLKELKDFDWTFNPKIPKPKLVELAAARFVGQHQDLLLIGPPGLGKSHIAKALAQLAVQRGFRVIYREAHVLIDDIHEARELGQIRKYRALLKGADLLVIDDLFLRKLPAHAGDELADVLMSRYEKQSTLVTSNRSIEDWPKLLGDVVVVTPLLDRLLHHGHLLKFEGKSWRLRESAARLAKNAQRT